MDVLNINLKTGSLDPGAPVHEIGLIVFNTKDCTLKHQVQLFPRVTENECDALDIASLLYSGVDMEEVMHNKRPSLKQCLEFVVAYVSERIPFSQLIYMAHNVSFTFTQLREAFNRCSLKWVFPVPIFSDDSDPGKGYVDTAELINLCNTNAANCQLETLCKYFCFYDVYTQTHLATFLKNTFLLNYFYQDGLWRQRSAVFDALKTCYLYQQIKARASLPKVLPGTL